MGDAAEEPKVAQDVGPPVIIIGSGKENHRVPTCRSPRGCHFADAVSGCTGLSIAQGLKKVRSPEN